MWTIEEMREEMRRQIRVALWAETILRLKPFDEGWRKNMTHNIGGFTRNFRIKHKFYECV